MRKSALSSAASAALEAGHEVASAQFELPIEDETSPITVTRRVSVSLRLRCDSPRSAVVVVTPLAAVVVTVARRLSPLG